MPEITKETIITRKTTLLKELAQVKANMNATLGAIQDCNYWFAQLAEEEKEDKKV